MFGPSHDDSRDHDRDPDSDGYGSDRDDSPFASKREARFMPMTRRDRDGHEREREPEYSPSVRDVDRLYDHALRDTSSFLKKRDEHVKTRGVGEQALSIGEMFAGAVLGGYLSQRFRASGGAVPTGLLLGAIGFGAAQFTQMFGRYGEDVKNLAIGSALASGVIWAAGYGSLSAEKAQAKTEGNFPATGGAPARPEQMQPPQPPPQLQPWPMLNYPQHPAYAQPTHATPGSPSMADFQNLVTRRAA